MLSAERCSGDRSQTHPLLAMTLGQLSVELGASLRSFLCFASSALGMRRAIDSSAAPVICTR